MMDQKMKWPPTAKDLAAIHAKRRERAVGEDEQRQAAKGKPPAPAESGGDPPA